MKYSRMSWQCKGGKRVFTACHPSKQECSTRIHQTCLRNHNSGCNHPSKPGIWRFGFRIICPSLPCKLPDIDTTLPAKGPHGTPRRPSEGPHSSQEPSLTHLYHTTSSTQCLPSRLPMLQATCQKEKTAIQNVSQQTIAPTNNLIC